MTRRALVLRYAGFAVLAVLANLGAQRIVLAVLGAGALGHYAALAIGTGVGLVLKYLLDKRWIFFDRSTGVAAHGKRFSLYTLTGVVTTAIFWGSTTAFWMIFDSLAMRDLGAVLGLAVGYVVKYRLDRRFVFAAATP
jgi:hypothetical protein